MSQGSSQRPLRARIERGIYKRQTSDGQTRYEVAYLDSDGHQRWRTVDRLQDARDLRAELVSKVRRGERVAPSRVTLREYTDAWLAGEKARLRPSTHERYRGNLETHIYPPLGHRRLTDVTVDDVASLIGDLQRKGKAGWTIRGVLVALGRVLSSAERKGLIGSNPVRKLERRERPTVKRTQFPELDKAAIGNLIASVPTRYRTLVAVSVITGIRQSEALGLQWQDINIKSGTIAVRRQLDRKRTLVPLKTEAARRDVPIPPSLGRMLTTHKKNAFARGHAKPTDYVFTSDTGGPLDHCNIRKRALEKATTAANLPRLRWHDLRHLAASMLIAEGAPASYVAAVLGHATPAITLSIYAHLFAGAEHADRTRERMEAAFADILK